MQSPSLICFVKVTSKFIENCKLDKLESLTTLVESVVVI